MNLFYQPNIQFVIENVSFFISNIACEQFLVPVPKHAHGNESYELHYISSGYGSARINGSVYKLVPDMLYITGPHIEHEQVPYIGNPMTEYSVFFNIKTLLPHPVWISLLIRLSGSEKTLLISIRS